MAEQIPQQPLFDARIAAPTSEPPTLATLNERVSQVRRQRRIVRGTVSAVALTCVVGSLAFWHRTTEEISGETQIAVTDPNSNIMTDGITESIVTPKESSSRPPRIQLYANLVDAVPVFDYDKETKVIHHVGWVESEQRVPVDMNYVPQQQQETFNAALSSNDTWDFGL